MEKRLIMFYKQVGCPSCRQQKELNAKFTFEIPLEMKDVEEPENLELCKSHGLKGVPSFVYLEDGEVKYKHTGLIDPRVMMMHIKGEI